MKLFLWFSILSLLTLLLDAKEVSISVGGKQLSGKLSVVKQDQSRVVFILSGSGPTDMDGNTAGASGKNNSLKYLSEALNKENIATLRVDKRGVGKSANAAIKEADLRFSTYVDDAKDWIKFLEKQGYTEIFLIGHSEGALVATLAASSESVKGLVCIAGAGRTAPVILREQLKPNLPENLYTKADQVISSLVEGKVVKNLHPVLNSMFRPSVQPYLISWFRIDPVKAISEVQVPVLVVQGSTDLQVSKKDAGLLHAAAKDSHLVTIEGMNHILKEVQGDLRNQIPSYFDPHLPLHKDLMANVIKFVRTTKQ